MIVSPSFPTIKKALENDVSVAIEIPAIPGKEKEIFSDEFDRVHNCSACGKEIDFTQCKLEGEATSSTPS